MFRKFLLFAVFAAILAACGGSAGPATELTVDMTDLMFNPANLEATAGQINLNLSNSGAVEHNFLVLKPGATYTSSTDVKLEDILFETKLAAGESRQFSLTLAEAGEYPVICTVPGHLEAGMVGKLVVK
jgi:uncharacterized cupredoxin-like copper-binding protein